MAKVLIPIPQRDFDPTEAAVSWSVLKRFNHSIVFATPDGRPGRADDLMLSGEGLDRLGERIERELAHTLRPIELLVPYSEGASLAELHEAAGELAREDTAEGVRVRALVPAQLAERFARFAVA